MKFETFAAITALTTEVQRATELFPINDCAKRHLPHYYLGVIEEEFEEFKKEVFAFNLGKHRDTRPEMKTELLHLAAMAMRAYVEI